jgi:hypothetical protein
MHIYWKHFLPHEVGEGDRPKGGGGGTLLVLELTTKRAHHQTHSTPDCAAPSLLGDILQVTTVYDKLVTRVLNIFWSVDSYCKPISSVFSLYKCHPSYTYLLS